MHAHLRRLGAERSPLCGSDDEHRRRLDNLPADEAAPELHPHLLVRRKIAAELGSLPHRFTINSVFEV